MEILREKAPVRPEITKTLRSLEINEECAVVDLKERNKISATIDRLKKKEGLNFIAKKSDGVLKVWRVA